MKLTKERKQNLEKLFFQNVAKITQESFIFQVLHSILWMILKKMKFTPGIMLWNSGQKLNGIKSIRETRTHILYCLNSVFIHITWENSILNMQMLILLLISVSSLELIKKETLYTKQT